MSYGKVFIRVYYLLFMNRVAGFVGSVQERRTEREYFESCQMLFEDLAKSEFDRGRVEDLLRNTPDEVLGALYWAMENKRLSLDVDVGKSAWKRVRQFYHDNDMTEEFDEVAKGLYEIVAPTKSAFLDFYSNFVGVFASVFTLGYEPASPITEDLQRRACGKFINRHLGQLE